MENEYINQMKLKLIEQIIEFRLEIWEIQSS